MRIDDLMLTVIANTIPDEIVSGTRDPSTLNVFTPPILSIVVGERTSFQISVIRIVVLELLCNPSIMKYILISSVLET